MKCRAIKYQRVVFPDGTLELTITDLDGKKRIFYGKGYNLDAKELEIPEGQDERKYGLDEK